MNDLLDKLLSSRNYAAVCPDTIRRVVGECEGRYKPKDLEKAVRTRLHAITGAFMTPKEAAAAREALDAWKASPSDDLLTRVLERHSSTRERLPLAETDALFDRVFAVTGAPASILDLACGIDPVYLGARGHAVTGVDLSGDAIDLVNRFGAPVKGVCADLMCEGALPPGHFDLALAFKLLPVLETQKKGAAADLLQKIDAGFIAVSFPTRTLGGRNIGMEGHYSQWMAENLPDTLTACERFTHGSELIYILKR